MIILPEEMNIRYSKKISKLGDEVISLSNYFVKECKEKNINLYYASKWFLLQFQDTLNKKLLKNKKRKENKNAD